MPRPYASWAIALGAVAVLALGAALFAWPRFNVERERTNEAARRMAVAMVPGLIRDVYVCVEYGTGRGYMVVGSIRPVGAVQRNTCGPVVPSGQSSTRAHLP